MALQPLELRPMTVADLIDATIRLYRHNFAPILGIAAIVQIPMVTLQAAASYYMMRTLLMAEGTDIPWDQLMVGGVGFGVLFLVALTLLPLGEAALAVGISERYLGRMITVSGAYQVALKCWWRVLWTSLIYWLWAYLWMLGGLILLILPGLVLLAVALVRYLLAPAVVVVLEGTWGKDAMRRSWHLTQGHGWRVFSTMAILVLMVMVATYGLTVPLQLGIALAVTDEQYLLPATVAYQVVQAVVTVILQPLWMIGAVLVYYDLRIRKEGFDLLMMADALKPVKGEREERYGEPLFPDEPDLPPGKE